MLTLPEGFRLMRSDEIARLMWGELVNVLDTHNGEAMIGTVQTTHDDTATVRLRSGCLLRFPGETQFVPLAKTLARGNDDLEVALRLSNRLVKLEREYKRLADVLLATPTREMYDALLADNLALHDKLRALSLSKVA